MVITEFQVTEIGLVRENGVTALGLAAPQATPGATSSSCWPMKAMHRMRHWASGACLWRSVTRDVADTA